VLIIFIGVMTALLAPLALQWALRRFDLDIQRVDPLLARKPSPSLLALQLLSDGEDEDCVAAETLARGVAATEEEEEAEQEEEKVRSQQETGSRTDLLLLAETPLRRHSNSSETSSALAYGLNETTQTSEQHRRKLYRSSVFQQLLLAVLLLYVDALSFLAGLLWSTVLLGAFIAGVTFSAIEPSVALWEHKVSPVNDWMVRSSPL